MKKNFLTGFVILLPIALTFMILAFVINLLTKPFLGIVEKLFEGLGIRDLSLLFIDHATVLMLVSKGVILLLLASVVILVGMLGEGVILGYFTRGIDYIFHRIPLVNRIYKAIQEVVHTLFNTQSTAYSSVVLVPFPHANTHSIGLVTSTNMPEGTDQEHMGLVSVFVPASPNPTFGFMLLYKREDLIFVDMKVEDALRFIVSCGVMSSDFGVSREEVNIQDISAK